MSAASLLPSDLELSIETGPQTGHSHALPVSGQLTLGRGDDCDIRFTNEHQMMISRRHARIQVRGDGIFLVDLASGRGTKVNDHVVAAGKEMALGPGSRIQLGLPDGPIVALRTAGGDGQPKGGTVLVNQPSRKNLPQQLDILMQANKALESENQRLNEQNQSMREKNTALGSENERLAQKVIALEQALSQSGMAPPASGPAASLASRVVAAADWDRADELFGGFSKALLDIKEALRGSSESNQVQSKITGAIFKLDNFRQLLQSLRSTS